MNGSCKLWFENQMSRHADRCLNRLVGLVRLSGPADCPGKAPAAHEKNSHRNSVKNSGGCCCDTFSGWGPASYCTKSPFANQVPLAAWTMS